MSKNILLSIIGLNLTMSKNILLSIMGLNLTMSKNFLLSQIQAILIMLTQSISTIARGIFKSIFNSLSDFFVVDLLYLPLIQGTIGC